MTAGTTMRTLLELLDFLRSRKKWWIIPIVVFLLLIGALMVAADSAISHFLYVLF